MWLHRHVAVNNRISEREYDYHAALSWIKAFCRHPDRTDLSISNKNNIIIWLRQTQDWVFCCDLSGTSSAQVRASLFDNIIFFQWPIWSSLSAKERLARMRPIYIISILYRRWMGTLWPFCCLIPAAEKECWYDAALGPVMSIAAFVLAHWGLLYLPLRPSSLLCEAANELFSTNSPSPDPRRAPGQTWEWTRGRTETPNRRTLIWIVAAPFDFGQLSATAAPLISVLTDCGFSPAFDAHKSLGSSLVDLSSKSVNRISPRQRKGILTAPKENQQPQNDENGC